MAAMGEPDPGSNKAGEPGAAVVAVDVCGLATSGVLLQEYLVIGSC